MTEKEKKNLSKDELQLLINEMTTQVVKVAELVDQVFPDKAVGEGIKKCADQLRTHVNTLTTQVVKERLAEAAEIPVSELVKMAKKECHASFKLLTSLRESNIDGQASVFETVGLHARELFETIVSYETCIKGDTP